MSYEKIAKTNKNNLMKSGIFIKSGGVYPAPLSCEKSGGVYPAPLSCEKSGGVYPAPLSRESGAGFTLIEMLVIIAILTVFSGILLSYNKDSGRQMLLVANQAKLVSLISRAKSLSISTFLASNNPPNPGDPITCSIGVHVDRVSGEVFIFRDLAVDCSLLADNKYTDDSERAGFLGELNVLKLDSKITEFTPPAADDLNDIVFIPPDPQILINNDPIKLNAQVSIKIKDSNTSKIIIRVNNAGQISTK